MTKIIQIENYEEKLNILIYLRTNIIPESIPLSSKQMFKKKASQFKFINSTLMLLKNNGYKEFICKYESEKKLN